jgi:hypothetical protein
MLVTAASVEASDTGILVCCIMPAVSPGQHSLALSMTDVSQRTAHIKFITCNDAVRYIVGDQLQGML